MPSDTNSACSLKMPKGTFGGPTGNAYGSERLGCEFYWVAFSRFMDQSVQLT